MSSLPEWSWSIINGSPSISVITRLSFNFRFLVSTSAATWRSRDSPFLYSSHWTRLPLLTLFCFSTFCPFPFLNSFVFLSSLFQHAVVLSCLTFLIRKLFTYFSFPPLTSQFFFLFFWSSSHFTSFPFHIFPSHLTFLFPVLFTSNTSFPFLSSSHASFPFLFLFSFLLFPPFMPHSLSFSLQTFLHFLHISLSFLSQFYSVFPLTSFVFPFL